MGDRYMFPTVLMLGESEVYASGFRKLGGQVVDISECKSWDQADLLHVPSISGIRLDDLRQTLIRARSKGMKTSLDPNLEGRWPSDMRALFLESVLPELDRLLLSEEDAGALGGREDPEAAGEFISSCAPKGFILVVKLGRRGALLFDGDRRVRISSFPYFNVKDRIGVGDTFNCTMDFFMQGGKSADESAILASANARASLERYGGTEGQLDREELYSLVDNYDLIERREDGIYEMRLPEVKALFLDMDGLMALSEDLQIEAFNEMMRRKGFANFALSPQEKAFFVGREDREDCLYLKERYGLKEDLEDIVRERKEIYLELVRERGVEPNDGLAEIFDEAKRRGLKILVVTNSPDRDVEVVLESMFRKMGISQPPEEFFDGISTVSKVRRQKPFPDVYILAAQMAGVEPRYCIALEDSESGVRSARAAGIMRVLAVPHEYTQIQDFTEAFAVLENLREAMRFIA